jgi:predicted metal-binding protein
MDKSILENIFAENGFASFKWIGSEDVVISQWVRFKCMFGCSGYGKKGTCPPNVPSVSDCREFFSEYKTVVIFQIEKQFESPNDKAEWGKEINLRLLKIEREVFLTGYHKAFLLFMDECRLCETCSGSRNECNDTKNSRPCPEALGIDVFATARNCGFPIQVLKDYSETMNRYSFILVD